MKSKFRNIIFKIVTWAIRKYFSDGLTPVFGTNSASDKIIAWKWMWYDEKYKTKQL